MYKKKFQNSRRMSSVVISKKNISRQNSFIGFVRARQNTVYHELDWLCKKIKSAQNLGRNEKRTDILF